MMRFLLEWVVTASLLILAVIALRALLGRRISAGLRYALWTVVLVRLLVPLQFFSLPVPAVFPEADREPITTSAAPAATVPVLQGEPVGVPAIAAPQPSGVVVNHDAAVMPSDAALDVVRFWDVLGWLWLAGSAGMAVVFALSNLRFARRLRRVRIPLEGADCSLPVYLAENLPSPCLFGLVRPGVYVTAETAQDPSMLRHILAHEHTHFHHGDHVWNVLRSVALAVHWWNPLVWLSVVLSGRDCELACDEGALKRLGDGERIAYGRTLLALITVKARPGDLLRCATTMTGGQKSVFDRVTRIARTPKRWLWAAVVAVIATALACVCAFGQAEEAPDFEEPLDLTADLTFSLSEADPRAVTIQGTVGAFKVSSGTSWSPVSIYDIDLLGQIFIPYPPFSEENGMIAAWWADESRTAVTVTGQPLPLTTSGGDYSSWRTFTVSLNGDNGSITESHTHGSEENIYLASLSDGEAVTLARIAAKLLTAAEDFYNNAIPDQPPETPAPTQPSVPSLTPAYALDEYGVSVAVIGLDCEGGRWYSKTHCSTPITGTALGELEVSNPQFLGEEFADTYSSVTAQYSPEEGRLWMDVLENNPGTLGSRTFLVDLSAGTVAEQEIDLPEWKGTKPVPPDQVLADAARTLAWLIGDTSEFYQASLPAPEEGPLPFDTPMKLMFCSGAGAWKTLLTLHPDGSFEGNYYDMDMGDSGSGYQSTQYVCQFHGRFGDITQMTDASWSLALEELVLDTGHPIGEEWIETIRTNEGSYNLRYISSAPYGFSKRDSEGYSIPLEPGARFMLYTPDASGYRPTDELYGFNSANTDHDSIMYQFWTWMPSGRKIGAWGWDTTLGCYALCSRETGYGFFDLKAWGIA